MAGREEGNYCFVNAQVVPAGSPGKHRLIAMQGIASESDGGKVSGEFEYAAEEIFNYFWLVLFRFRERDAL
jgi:hypothetical protein